MNAQKEDYIDHTTDGTLSFQSASRTELDSEEGIEDWMNGVHETSMRRCTQITRSLW